MTNKELAWFLDEEYLKEQETKRTIATEIAKKMYPDNSVMREIEVDHLMIATVGELCFVLEG